MEELIKRFLFVSSGYGSGDGDGYGSGYGSGSGSGSGYGYGYGDGDGSDSGYGSGYGDGIKEYNRRRVYIIDDTQTLIDSVHGNYAKGSIINSNLTLSACYIAKVGNYFAHGKTLEEALHDATEKYNSNKPVKERIADFLKAYPSLDSMAEHKDLYVWHNTLTGSCTFGRDQFVKERGLDKDNGKMSIRDFIKLTENAYGGDIIRQLAKAYK